MRRSASWATVVLIAVAAAATTRSRDARSSDHTDSGDPAADIGDLYAFSDNERFVMIMTVHPFAEADATFSTSTQYVFHTSSGPAFGQTTSDVDVICTFASPKAASCWVGTEDYASGDPSNAEAPLTSASGKVQVFAGLRGDPFFFNLTGFLDTVAIVKGAASALELDAAGCPAVDTATSQALVSTLSEVATDAHPDRTNPDDFATANTLALVVSVDESLVTEGGNIVAVWASTHEGQ